MFFNLGMATSLGVLKTVKLHLKIDLVSHPTCMKGLGKCIYYLNLEKVINQKV